MRAGGKRYVLRYEEREDEWTLQSEFDGPELLARPNIAHITVEPRAIRQAESMIAGCEFCKPDTADHPFDCILAEMLDKRGFYEFILAETARCPNCKVELSEKTLVEPHGGIEVEETVLLL